jgi:hypothetical protein
MHHDMHVCVNESVHVRERAHVHLCVCVCVCARACIFASRPALPPTTVTLRQQLFDPTLDPVAHTPMLLL